MLPPDAVVWEGSGMLRSDAEGWLVPALEREATLTETAMRQRAVSPSRRASAIARRHWPLLVVLGVAAALRAIVQLTYWPALMWADSWQYVYAARELPAGFAQDKPNGYPLVLRAIGKVSDSLAAVTVAQHLIGLTVGVLVYVALVRNGAGRVLATVAAAIVLLDAYALALEQHVLAEALYALLLTLFAAVVVRGSPSVPVVALAGGLLVAATTVRALTLFAFPVWFVYCLWAFPDWRRRATGVLAVVVPFAAYLAWHAAAVGGFGLNSLDGWTLYSRTAQLADCRVLDPPTGTERLCPDPAARSRLGDDPVTYFQFNRQSPVARAYGDPFSLRADRLAAANGAMRSFATATIRQRPLAFAGLIATDTAKYFVPGRMSPVPYFDQAVTMPAEPRPVRPNEVKARDAYAPGYAAGPARGPADALATYGRVVHTPRWLVALLTLVAAVVVAAGLKHSWAARLPHRREVLLTVGVALALLAGSALNHFEPRYLIPAVPLFVIGGTLALVDLRAAAGGRQA
jgi:hypothetical protein